MISKIGETLLRGWIAFCIVFWVAVLLGVIGIFCIVREIGPKSDPSLYADILRERVDWSEHYTIFPENIPDNAVNVAFYHRPKCLQGYDLLSLRVSLPPEATETVLKELESSGRTEVGPFGDPSGLNADVSASPHTYPKYDREKSNSRNRSEGQSELPDDFRIFLFKCDLEDDDSYICSKLSFTAVSTKRSEVVYYTIVD